LGTTPFIPPPPSCDALPDHDAGSTTLKLIGLAVLAVSIGAIDPLTRQWAGAPFADSTHDGGDSVTARTGSPMADVGIDAPTRSAVQSAAVITLRAAAVGVAVGAALPCLDKAGAAESDASVTAANTSTAGIIRNIHSLRH
jgi:hypothetical protein